MIGGDPSSVLQEVNMTILNPKICQNSYSTLPNFNITLPNGFNGDHILCIGDTSGKKDACQVMQIITRYLKIISITYLNINYNCLPTYTCIKSCDKTFFLWSRCSFFALFVINQ